MTALTTAVSFRLLSPADERPPKNSDNSTGAAPIHFAMRSTEWSRRQLSNLCIALALDRFCNVRHENVFVMELNVYFKCQSIFECKHDRFAVGVYEKHLNGGYIIIVLALETICDRVIRFSITQNYRCV